MHCGRCRPDVEAPAVAYCYDCSVALCELCCSVHARANELSSHNYKSLDDIGRQVEVTPVPRKQHYPCSKHPDEILKLFCITCDVVICRDCILMDHKDHEYNFVQNVVDTEKDNLRTKVTPFREKLEQLEKTKEEMERAKKQAEKVSKQREAEINAGFDQCREELEQRRRHFLERLRGATELKFKTFTHQLEEIDSTYSQLRSMVEFTSKVVETASNVEVLTYKKEILSRVESLHQLYEHTPQEVPEEDKAAFVIEKAAVRELGAMIEVPCAQMSTAEGPALKEVLQSEESTVVVSAHNSQGHALIHGGGECTAKLSCVPTMTGEEVGQEAEVRDNKDGSYTIGFTPAYPGKATLDVFFDNVAIKDSPFEIDVVRNYTNISLEPFAFDVLNASPWGLTMLNDNEIAVTSSDCVVHIYTAKGEEIETIRSNFTRPYGIWSDNEQSLWITDREAHNIQWFSRQSGKFEKVFQFGLRGTNPGQFFHPRGITVHSATGCVYVSDMKNNRIQIFRQESPLPKYQGHFGGSGKTPGLFNLPAGLCFNQRDQLLICDDHNCRIQVFDPEGKFLHTLGTTSGEKGLLCSPIGVSCDTHGRYVLTEFGSHTVTFMSPEGKILSCVRYLGEECGQFFHPRGITCDSVGYVYVADNENLRIVRF